MVLGTSQKMSWSAIAQAMKMLITRRKWRSDIAMRLVARPRAARPTVCPAWKPVAEAPEVCRESWRTRSRKEMIQPANVTIK